MGVITRGSALLAQSWSLLRANPSLMAFPVISGFAQMAVLASCAAALVVSGGLPRLIAAINESPTADSEELFVHAIAWPILLGFYLVAFFVQTFFGTALIGAAIEFFAGRPATLGTGMRVAMSRLPQIVGWTLVSASVGLILQVIAERLGFVGRIVIHLLGFGWAVATYFVVPTVAAEGLGPIAAMRRSADILRRRWGDALLLQASVGPLVVMAIGLTATGVFMISYTAMLALQTPMALIAGIAMIAAIVLIGAVVGSTIMGVLRAALYHFAISDDSPRGFDRALLEKAFLPPRSSSRSRPEPSA